MKNYRKRFLAIIIFTTLILYLYYNARLFLLSHTSEAFQPDIAQKVLRFHVIANSDLPEDQAIKLLVRNSIGTYLAPLLDDTSSQEEAMDIVALHLTDIEQIANHALEENGCNYRATAFIGSCTFPEKIYGEFTFPPGDYTALNVTLGEGNGQNFWCVLYPNMCFRGSVYEVVEEDAKQALKQVLSEDEYEAVIRSGNYKIRFKFLEYFDQTRYNSR